MYLAYRGCSRTADGGLLLDPGVRESVHFRGVPLKSRGRGRTSQKVSLASASGIACLFRSRTGRSCQRSRQRSSLQQLTSSTEVEDDALWEAVQRAQAAALKRQPEGSAIEECLVSVGEVARQGLPLAGLERRLFALAAEHPARIVTTKSGEIFFRFHEQGSDRNRKEGGKSLNAMLARAAPYFLFGAAESFFLFFPLPFIALRIVAIAFAAPPEALPRLAWFLLWPGLLPAYGLKRWIYPQGRGAEEASGNNRENFVEKWARAQGLMWSADVSKSAAEKWKRGYAPAPLWQWLIEELWPWERDVNREILGSWRYSILAQLVLAKGGKLTAREMAPYLDPDPKRHRTVDEFLADADGLAQPFVAALGGSPDWEHQAEVVYSFPKQLFLEASEMKPPALQGGKKPWLSRVMSWARAGLKRTAAAVGFGRTKLPSYIEELPSRPWGSNPALRAQLKFCVLASVWLAVASSLGCLGPRVGFVPVGVAARSWPLLLAVAVSLYFAQLQRAKATARCTALAAFRNRIRYEAAWRSARRLGQGKAIPVDLEKERWYDTAERLEDFELRRFDEKL